VSGFSRSGKSRITIPRLLRRFRRNLRDYGLGVTLRKTGASLFGFIYRTERYRIYRIELDAWEAALPSSEDLEYRFLRPEEDKLIAQIESLEEWLGGSVKRKLELGAICLAALDGGTVAGFNLVSFGQVYIPLIDVVRRFPERTAWSEQITVHPGYRGRGVASKLRYRIFSELRSRRVARFYGGAHASNTASLGLAHKVGFREFVEVDYRKLFSVRTRMYRRLKL
jgi:GNAT superfamily N-acetyltransferase